MNKEKYMELIQKELEMQKTILSCTKGKLTIQADAFIEGIIKGLEISMEKLNEL